MLQEECETLWGEQEIDTVGRARDRHCGDRHCGESKVVCFILPSLPLFLNRVQRSHARGCVINYPTFTTNKNRKVINTRGKKSPIHLNYEQEQLQFILRSETQVNQRGMNLLTCLLLQIFNSNELCPTDWIH